MPSKRNQDLSLLMSEPATGLLWDTPPTGMHMTLPQTEAKLKDAR